MEEEKWEGGREASREDQGQKHNIVEHPLTGDGDPGGNKYVPESPASDRVAV